MSVRWEGALGGSRNLAVGWAFDRHQHLKAEVRVDDAPMKTAPKNAKMLDDYFRDTVYPRLVARMGALKE